MLTLHFHPLSSYCWKVLVALYENDTPFERLVVDLGDETSRAAFYKLWPGGRFPVLQDRARGEVVPESSIIIEYLAAHHPGPVDLVGSGDLARQIRLADRIYDTYIHEPMQKVVGDKLRPQDKADPLGVEQARRRLRSSYAMIEQDLAEQMRHGRAWSVGDGFTMADCSAFPALFYANKLEPFGEEHGQVARYLDRLLQRPSVARTVEEARPYFWMFPYNDA
jgi:glutathione S-transferase